MQIEELQSKYQCDEYFAQNWHQKGYLDEESQTPVIVPFDETFEDANSSFFVMGRSGSDGINFGFRPGHPGLWAYYPIEQDFKYMAATIEELVAGWISGKLSG
jgi:hypothetical protein